MNEQELLHINHAGAESTFAVGQIKLPHALEPHVELVLGEPRPGGIEPVTPFGKRAGVVKAEPVRFHQLQPGILDRALEPRHRWQHAAGENVPLDEIGIAHIFVKGIVLDGDGLQRRAPPSLRSEEIASK